MIRVAEIGPKFSGYLITNPGFLIKNLGFLIIKTSWVLQVETMPKEVFRNF